MPLFAADPLSGSIKSECCKGFEDFEVMALGHSCGGRSVTVVTESAKTSTRIRVGALPPVMQQKYKNIEIQKHENTKIPTMSAKPSTRIRFGAVVPVMQRQHVNTFVTSTCT